MLIKARGKEKSFHEWGIPPLLLGYLNFIIVEIIIQVFKRKCTEKKKGAEGNAGKSGNEVTRNQGRLK